jgi:SAM-dependent methyltransferase
MNKVISKWEFLLRVALHPIDNLKQLRNWQLIEAFWKTNESKIALWMRYESVVTKAINENLLQEERYRKFDKDFDTFRCLSGKTVTRFAMRRGDILACFDELSDATPFDRHYLYHPAWAARVLARTRPDRHVDISSILSFSAIVSAFIPVDFYEYRPACVTLSNFQSGKADLLRLPFSDKSLRSVSCMHVIEHIGLGRYGEALDPDGDLKAIRELVRVLAAGGNLLVVVPVGRPRIQFNAHRIYDFAEFRDYFSGLELIEFALIPDDDGHTGLLYNGSPEFTRAQSYGCGCFWFKKPDAPEH